MTALEEIKKAIEGVGPLKVEFTPDCDEFNSIIAPINEDYDGTFFTVIGCGDKQDKLGGYMALAVNKLPELLSTLESLQREKEELRNLADRLKQEAQIHSMEARGANATVNEIYQIISGGKGEPGNWRGAKPVREYVEAAKGEILRLETELALSKPVYSRRQIEARVKVLEAALKPFAEYMGDHFDKDNHGDPLPDDLGVGWIYLTHADFRRARTALASTGGEHNGN